MPWEQPLYYCARLPFPSLLMVTPRLAEAPFRPRRSIANQWLHPEQPRFLLFAKSYGWLLGFALVFNPYLIPSEAEGAPRLSDLIGIVLWGLVMLRCITGYKYGVRFPSELKLATGLIFVWLLRYLLVGESLLNGVGPVRWLLAVPYAYALYRIACDPIQRTAMAAGLCLGIVGNLGVLGLQSAGYSDLMIQRGLSSGRWGTVWIATAGESAFRAQGMWGHPNASAGVIAICLPIICGLVDEGRIKPRWIIGAWLILLASSALTFTRSGIVVSAIVSVVWAFAAIRGGRYVWAKMAVLSITILGVVLIGPPGGWPRWLNSEDFAENSADRAESTWHSVQLAFYHPLGIGSNYSQELARSTSSGIEATHDAWLFLALIAGLPLALYLLLGLVRRAARLFGRPGIEGWLALQLLGLFFFEEFFRVPLFAILTLWLLIAPKLVPKIASCGQDGF